jgi:hypothetical protein
VSHGAAGMTALKNQASYSDAATRKSLIVAVHDYQNQNNDYEDGHPSEAYPSTSVPRAK